VFVILLLLVLLGRPKVGHDTITGTVSGPPTTLQPSEAVRRAAKTAARYWGGSNCLHVTYRYRDLPGQTIAQAEWYSSALAPTHYLQCTITFDDRRLPYAAYCAVVVHEFGHLDGHLHSRDPHSVMFPFLSDLLIPSECDPSG
jgi:hypothetical protein